LPAVTSRSDPQAFLLDGSGKVLAFASGQRYTSLEHCERGAEAGRQATVESDAYRRRSGQVGAWRFCGRRRLAAPCDQKWGYLAVSIGLAAAHEEVIDPSPNEKNSSCSSEK
jgi:hypothetical protein